jgi:hypothetical protein
MEMSEGLIEARSARAAEWEIGAVYVCEDVEQLTVCYWRYQRKLVEIPCLGIQPDTLLVSSRHGSTATGPSFASRDLLCLGAVYVLALTHLR